MKKLLWIALTLVFVLGCTLTAQRATPTLPPAAPPAAGETPAEKPSPTPLRVSGPTPTVARGGQRLPPFTAALDAPFSAQTSLAAWSPPTPAADAYRLPLSLDQLANLGVAENLTAEQRAFLAKNGFVVVPTREKQFSDIRRRVSDLYGQPYFLSTDAAYHALHLTFDELLKALERERLRPQMIGMVRAALDQVMTYRAASLPAVADDTALAVAYLAVALRLFDPAAALPAELEARIQPQLKQIAAFGGVDQSVLIPDFKDDYGAYRPVGHYAGDPELEAYFQGMTWLGRVDFLLVNPEKPTARPSRAPLIVTLALRQAQVEGEPAAQVYARIHEVLTYLIGPTDDSGPVELAALMDRVYGADIVFDGLADESLWLQFQARLSELPAPQINSTFVDSLSSLEPSRSWRFMGQRFVLDSFILQNMLFDKVGTMDKQRLVPSGLDVMAAVGSQAALEAQEKAGQTAYENYLEQLARMQQAVNAQPEAQWIQRFYSGWLYAFLPQVAVKSAVFPPAMRTKAWEYKDLNSALGSWAELKRDTALYTKLPEPAGGGGPPASGPAPAYVEPNPQVFYRLAYISASIVEGLMQRGIMQSGDWSMSGTPGLDNYLRGMQQLGGVFEELGRIAADELAGKLPESEDDRYLIQACLGFSECQVEQARAYGQEMEEPPVPVIAAVSGAGPDQVLQAGVGYVERIYVVVPLEGKLQIAQGGVFSYYEFTQPRGERLTDQAWRAALDAETPPLRPLWTANFLLPDGKPADKLAMRIGDVYLMTEAGSEPPLNVRAQPSRTADILYTMGRDTYFEIVEGPVKVEGFTWWKVGPPGGWGDKPAGWIVENQAWYERARGQ